MFLVAKSHPWHWDGGKGTVDQYAQRTHITRLFVQAEHPGCRLTDETKPKLSTFVIHKDIAIPVPCVHDQA
jgi:hypothetical protein